MSRFVRTWTFFLCLNEIHAKAFHSQKAAHPINQAQNLLVILHQTVTILRWRKSIFFLEKVLIGAQCAKTTL